MGRDVQYTEPGEIASTCFVRTSCEQLHRQTAHSDIRVTLSHGLPLPVRDWNVHARHSQIILRKG